MLAGFLRILRFVVWQVGRQGWVIGWLMFLLVDDLIVIIVGRGYMSKINSELARTALLHFFNQEGNGGMS